MTQKNLITIVALATALLTGSHQTLVAQGPKPAQDQGRARVAPPSKTEFLRLVKDQSGTPHSLETSITRYRSDDDRLLVDLIAVVHVGELPYYRKLNRQFTQYESLLYELVAPEGNRVPDRQRVESSGNPIRWLQSSMQNLLGLESQLEHIDYSKANFVHAGRRKPAGQRIQNAKNRTGLGSGLGFEVSSGSDWNHDDADRHVFGFAR